MSGTHPSEVTARTTLPAWRAVADHARAIAPRHLRDLFAEDPSRADRFSFEACGLFVDHAKQRLAADSLARLIVLAEACGLRSRIDAMFSGHRAVLHVALRAPQGERILVDGRDVVPDVHEVLGRMAAFCRQIRSGTWKGHSGKPIRAIVNVGIGGSDLGPVMAYESLRPFAERLVEDVHDAGDDGQRPVGGALVGTGSRPRCRGHGRDTRVRGDVERGRGPLRSGCPKHASCRCGTGSADASPSRPPSAFRSCARSVPRISPGCSRACVASMCTSSSNPSNATFPC